MPHVLTPRPDGCWIGGFALRLWRFVGGSVSGSGGNAVAPSTHQDPRQSRDLDPALAKRTLVKHFGDICEAPREIGAPGTGLAAIDLGPAGSAPDCVGRNGGGRTHRGGADRIAFSSSLKNSFKGSKK